MKNIEQLLRAGSAFDYKVDMLDPVNPDYEPIAYVNLTLTSSKIVERNATKDATEAAEGTHGEFSEMVYRNEYNDRLIYWAIVYGVALDDKPAYQRSTIDGTLIGVQGVQDLIEFELGTNRDDYIALGTAILELSNMDQLFIDVPEDDEPEYTELESITNVTTP